MNEIGRTSNVQVPLPAAAPPPAAAPSAPAAGPATVGQTLNRSTVGVPSDAPASAGLNRVQGDLARQATGKPGESARYGGRTEFELPPTGPSRQQKDVGLAKEFMPKDGYKLTARKPITYPAGQTPPPAVKEALNPDGTLDLNKITPAMINQMSADERRQFMHNLAQIQVPTTDTNATGLSSWDGTDRADTVVARRIFDLESRAEPKGGSATAQLFAASPNAFPPPNDMKRSLRTMIAGNFEHVTRSLVELDQGKLSPDSCRLIGEFTQEHMSANKGNPAAFKDLLKKAYLGLGSASGPDGEYTEGALTGALAAGLLNSGQLSAVSKIWSDIAKDLTDIFPAGKLTLAGVKTLLTGLQAAADDDGAENKRVGMFLARFIADRGSASHRGVDVGLKANGRTV